MNGKRANINECASMRSKADICRSAFACRRTCVILGPILVAVAVLCCCCGAVVVLCKLCGEFPMRRSPLLWCCCGVVVALLWRCCGAAVVLLWCCGAVVVLLWCFVNFAGNFPRALQHVTFLLCKFCGKFPTHLFLRDVASSKP